MNNLRWRILLIVVIIGACLWAIIPPDQKIRLGLDLKGGVHLVPVSYTHLTLPTNREV